MARRIKVFFIVLFASAFFSVSVNAEFSGNDSLNLSSIRSDVSTIRGYIRDLSDIAINTSYSKSIYNWMVNHVYGLASYLDDFRRDFDDINSSINSVNSSVSVSNSWLSQIKSVLDQILGKLGVNTSLNVYHEFQNSKNFMDAWTTGNYSIIGNALVPVFSGDWITPKRNNDNVFLAPGTYAVSVQTNVNWLFNGVDSWVTNNGTVYVTFNNMAQPLFKVSAQPSWFVVDIYPADSNQQGEMAGASVDSAINNSNSNLSSGVDQIEGLEDQVFGSLDTSLGSIDFSGSALGQVVSGFNFIRAVFSAVYSSSPYISVLINLSCMFGVLALFLRVQPRFSRWEREHRDRSD